MIALVELWRFRKAERKRLIGPIRRNPMLDKFVKIVEKKKAEKVKECRQEDVQIK